MPETRGKGAGGSGQSVGTLDTRHPKPSTQVKLALLPEIPTDSPIPETGNIPNWLIDS